MVRRQNMERFLAKAKVVGLGLIAGSLFSGCCAAIQVPTSWDVAHRAAAWTWYMAGPFATVLMGISEITHPFVSGCVALGLLAIPMIAAHPIRPSIVTAIVSVVGFAFWFAASFFTVVWAAWGGVDTTHHSPLTTHHSPLTKAVFFFAHRFSPPYNAVHC